MTFRRSLRYRVSAALAFFGGAASLLLAVLLFVLFQGIEQRFVDDALDSEIEQYFTLRAADPALPLPRTRLLRVYAASGPGLPAPLAGLAPGRHERTIDGARYRVAVVDRADERFYFLYDEAGFARREQRIKLALGAGVLVMMLISAAGGVWMAGTVIAPVRELGRRVRKLDPAAPPSRLAQDFAADEIGELAATIESYLERLHGFMERERNFTAEASHELRTPLSVILGAAEVLLARRDLAATERTRVERIVRAAKEMGFTMEGLLALAREPQAQAAPGPCDVAEVAAKIVERHRTLPGERRVEIALAPRSRPQIAADRVLLAVALDNLVRNALMYTMEGRVTVAVEADRVVVEDTGPGLAGSHEAAAGLRPLGKRTGLGLPLVRRICERHRWRFAVQDRAEGGARAEIVFAAREARA